MSGTLKSVAIILVQWQVFCHMGRIIRPHHMPRVLEAAYCEDIDKPVHKPTNHSKHCTQNTNLRALLKLKQNDDCLSEELQSLLRPGPRCGPVDGCRLKSGLFNRYVIVGISEAFGVNYAGHQKATPALAHDHDRSDNYRQL